MLYHACVEEGINPEIVIHWRDYDSGLNQVQRRRVLNAMHARGWNVEDMSLVSGMTARTIRKLCGDVGNSRLAEGICFDCKRFKPGKPDNCQILEDHYPTVTKHKLKMIIRECPKYDQITAPKL